MTKPKFQQAIDWFYGFLRTCASEGNDMRDWSTLNEIEANTVGLRPASLGHNNPDSNRDEKFWAMAWLLAVKCVYMEEVHCGRDADNKFLKTLEGNLKEVSK